MTAIIDKKSKSRDWRFHVLSWRLAGLSSRLLSLRGRIVICLQLLCQGVVRSRDIHYADAPARPGAVPTTAFKNHYRVESGVPWAIRRRLQSGGRAGDTHPHPRGHYGVRQVRQPHDTLTVLLVNCLLFCRRRQKRINEGEASVLTSPTFTRPTHSLFIHR